VIKMKFEEQFPSLKEAALTIDGKFFTVKMAYKNKVKVFREPEIQEHCLDKQKVSDAIHTIIGTAHNLSEALSGLLKELKLK